MAGTVESPAELCGGSQCFRVEKLPRSGNDGLRIEIPQTLEHSMRGEHYQAGGLHVDKRHHGPVSSAKSGILAGIGQGGLVAVVAVGDQQFFGVHQLLQLADRRRVGDLPDRVAHSVLVFDARQRRAGSGLVQTPVDPRGRVVVQH